MPEINIIIFPICLSNIQYGASIDEHQKQSTAQVFQFFSNADSLTVTTEVTSSLMPTIKIC